MESKLLSIETLGNCIINKNKEITQLKDLIPKVEKIPQLKGEDRNEVLNNLLEKLEKLKHEQLGYLSFGVEEINKNKRLIASCREKIINLENYQKEVSHKMADHVVTKRTKSISIELSVLDRNIKEETENIKVYKEKIELCTGALKNIQE